MLSKKLGFFFLMWNKLISQILLFQTKIKSRLWILVLKPLLTLLFPWCRLGQHNWMEWTPLCWLPVTLPSTTPRVCGDNQWVFNARVAFVWTTSGKDVPQSLDKMLNGRLYLSVFVEKKENMKSLHVLMCSIPFTLLYFAQNECFLNAVASLTHVFCRGRSPNWLKNWKWVRLEWEWWSRWWHRTLSSNKSRLVP